ncbi:MAG: hypothetical protein PHF63_02400 [Herbinix sp.]|nr:hypothetical protein [Herbinix sp.]
MRKVRLISLIGISIAIIIGLTGCNNSNTKFSGSKTGNDKQFLVDFDVLNSTVDNDIPLTVGEMVETTIDIKKGDVDILVENENGTIAYRGNDVETGNFTIIIDEPGTYTFYVTGSKAKGSVSFIKSSSE